LCSLESTTKHLLDISMLKERRRRHERRRRRLERRRMRRTERRQWRPKGLRMSRLGGTSPPRVSKGLSVLLLPLKPPTASRISKAARYRSTLRETWPPPCRGRCGRSHQPLVGSLRLPAATARDPTAVALWSLWLKPPAVPWLPVRGLVGDVNAGPWPPSYSLGGRL
jgi:hypothetical protein